MGLPFNIMPSRVSEELVPGLAPRLQAEALARKKVETLIAILGGSNPPWILAADTNIIVDDTVLGKPTDREEAKAMLRRLSGRGHEVATGLALFNGKRKYVDCRTNVSVVDFAELSETEIEYYLDTGEWQGVAGAYRIQGKGGCFISSIRGSYSSIVGLPLHDFYVMLKENGYDYTV